MAYTLTEKSLSLILKGRPVVIPSSHPDWARIVAALPDEDRIKAILNPTEAYQLGQVWRTRGGNEATIVDINTKTRMITVELDEGYDMTLPMGQVIEGQELPEDLIECLR